MKTKLILMLCVSICIGFWTTSCKKQTVEIDGCKGGDPVVNENVTNFDVYVCNTIKSECMYAEGSLWVKNPSLNFADPAEQGFVDTLLFKNGICYKHSTLDGWAYNIKNGEIIFSKDGESKTYPYSSKGKDVMVIEGFEDVSVGNITGDVQYVKVREKSYIDKNGGNVIFYTNAIVMNTPHFVVTNIFVDSIFVGSLTGSYQDGMVQDPPTDKYETDDVVLNIPLSEGEHSFYALFGIRSKFQKGVRGTFTIIKGKCTKILIDAYKCEDL